MKIAMKLLAAAGAAAFDGTTTANGIGFYTDYVEWSCASGSLVGDVNLGTNSTGNGVANIDDTGWNNCIFFLGMEMTVDQIGTWDLNVQGDNVSGVIAGTITNVNARIASVTPGQCEFTVTGQAGGSFNETTQQLTVDDTSPDNDLVVSDVTGCFGQVLAGDPLHFAATYDITNSSDGGLVIASSRSESDAGWERAQCAPTRPANDRSDVVSVHFRTFDTS